MKQGMFLVLQVFFAACFLITSAMADPLTQQFIPVSISANSFSDLFGEKISHITFLKADRDKSGQIKLVHLSHQWSQMTNDNTVYTPAYKKVPMSGDPERLDEYDRVAFMYDDLGQESCRQVIISIHEGHENDNRLVEFQIDPRNGNMSSKSRRFVCALVHKADFQKFGEESGQVAGHARFSKKQNKAYSDFYSINLDENNPLIWTDFYFKNVNYDHGKPSGQSLLDSLKIIIDAGLFRENSRIQLDNSNLDTEIVDVQHGPVFDSMFAVTKVKLAGAKVLDMQIMVHFYKSHVEMLTRFKIPRIAGIIVKSPQVNVSLDGYDLWGSKIKTSWGPEKPLLVDGVMDENEKSFIRNEVSARDAWIWFSTQKGFDLLTFVEFDEAFNMPIALVYDDDREKNIEPERFPGQGPNVGYSIRGMVIGQYFTFKTHLFFSSTLDENELDERVIALRQPWDVISHDTLVLNETNQQVADMDAKNKQM